MNKYLQGRVQFPIGGTAHEPQGMIRCNSEADSTVWMEEDDYSGAALLLMFHFSGIYYSGDLITLNMLGERESFSWSMFENFRTDF